MPHNISQNNISCALILLIAVSFLFGCTETLFVDEQNDLNFELNKYNSANSKKGGRLYDRWWKEKNISSPTGANPIWEKTAIPESGKKANGGQWRCTECHGWDYKGGGETGIKGLDNTDPTFTPQFVFNMIADGQVTISNGAFDAGAAPVAHRFLASDKLNVDDVYNLTKFIITFANRDKIGEEVGDISTGKEVYLKIGSANNTCGSIGCHFSNKNILIKLAAENEAEFLHKVRTGNPGTLMPGGLSTQDAKDVLEFVKDGINLTVIPPSDFNLLTYNSLGKESIALGALLYDKWWEESTTGTKPDESSNHPLWPTTNQLQSGSETWRCKECHGWDYLGKNGAYGSDAQHKTQIRGIVNHQLTSNQIDDTNDIYAYLKEGSEHAFKGLLTVDATDPNKDEYYALTKFIMTMREEEKGNIASFDFIDGFKKVVGGDPVAGKALYETTSSFGTCASSSCHGTNGRAIDFADGNLSTPPDEFLDNIALENPWEFMHKLRFGQPGKTPIMNGLLLTTSPAGFSSIQTAIDILAYAQGDLTPNVKRGGLLFDKWWAADGGKSNSPPGTRNQTWIDTSDALSTTTTPITDSESWQCVQCHGWDYQGKDGAFGVNTASENYSNIRGLTQLSGATEADVIASITNNSATPDHSFEQYISSEDITLLAQFILDSAAGIPSVAGINNALDTSINDSNLGAALYAGDTPGRCETCHGTNGKVIPNVIITDRATKNPSRFIHKVRYGHPGSAMIPVSGGFEGLSLNDAGDLLAFSKTLSITNGENDTKVINFDNADYVRGGRLYDNWWLEKQSRDSNVIEPTLLNPQWADAAPQNNSTSWLCRSCHEWDYKGNGLYNGSTNLITKINDVLRPITYNNDEVSLQNGVFDFIKSGKLDDSHQFGDVTSSTLPTPMNDEDIWDLTKFLINEEGMIDSSAFLQNDGLVRNRDPNNDGEGIYNGTINSSIDCSAGGCHGGDGRNLYPPIDIFAIASPFAATFNPEGNPWRFLHRVRFGKPGTGMPSLIDLNIDINSAYDIHRYAQIRFYGR